MSDLLRGNFQVKNKVKLKDEKPDSDSEYRKKAINSVGGSMVFVERNKLVWDEDSNEDA
ncbi:hypothetical protein N9519_02590 [Candidatus Thioglobus sp.]|nr:hypothetical protein [Candidatus Thioglobus sp.]